MTQNGPRATAYFPVFLIISLFFLWGMANNLNDVLIAQFKKAFTLSDLQSGLVQSAFYMGYFLLALPAGAFMQRHGYKSAVVLGLALYGVGALMFWPAAELREYNLFLGALFVIASGLAFLETSANPLITVLGNPVHAAQRLNLAAAFNPLGSITGVLIGREFILSGVEHTPASLAALSPAALARFYDAEALAVQWPYLVIGLFVLGWALLTAITTFPAAANRPPAEEAATPFRPAVRALARRQRFVLGVVAQFFYVGAQVGIWSYLIRYGQLNVPGMGEKAAAAWLTWSLVLFMAGRFVGTALMSRLEPSRLMMMFGIVNIALCLVAAFVGGLAGLVALAATSIFMSIMFPTIFAMSLSGLGPLTKTGASFVVMSIIGGAVLTALMGATSDLASINMAILIPALCFAYITAFAATARKGAGAVSQGGASHASDTKSP